MPFNAEHCMQKCEKKSKFYFAIFLSFRWKELIVYYSVKAFLTSPVRKYGELLLSL